MAKKAKQKTYVAIVLDKSSSMSSNVAETISGFNEQLSTMQSKEKEQDVFLTLITFDHDVYEHYCNVAVSEVPKATKKSYVPNGTTAMHDASGYAINRLLKTTTPDENTAYLVILISDGMENASQHFTSAMVNSLREECEANGQWTFAFMGCNRGYVEQIARNYGVAMANCAVWDNKKSGRVAAKATRGTSKKLGSYLDARSKGVVRTANFYSDVSDGLTDYSTNDEEEVLVKVSDIQTTKTISPAGYSGENVVAMGSIAPEATQESTYTPPESWAVIDQTANKTKNITKVTW